MNPPDNLPPFPPVPPGFDRWAYRGPYWKPGRECIWTTLDEDGWIEDEDTTPSEPIGGSPGPYIEAVREPAREGPPHPGAPFESLEGLENLQYYTARAFTKSFTVGGSEPPTGVDASAIIAATLKALPVGYLPAHTPESIPERVADLLVRYAKAESQRVDWMSRTIDALAQVGILTEQKEAYAKTLRFMVEYSDTWRESITDRHPEITP